MKYWEIIANKIIKAGFSVGWVSALDDNGRTVWIADAHSGDGKRSIIKMDPSQARDFSPEVLRPVPTQN